MTITELIPTIQNLNRSDKIQLLQIIVNELAKEEEALVKTKNNRLKELAREIGTEAQNNRLTPEILEDILNSND